MQELGGQSTGLPSLSHQRIHFTVDPQTSESGSFAGPLREPVIPVPPSEDFD